MAFCGFQRRLREAKESSGKNNIQIAKACRVDRKAVSRWCNGHSEPSAERIYNLCIVLGVSSDWLLGLEDE